MCVLCMQYLLVVVLLCIKIDEKNAPHHPHNVKQYPMVQFSGLDFADSAIYNNNESTREREI